MAVGRVSELDRTEIRRRALERFSPGRMADEYEATYEAVIAAGSPGLRQPAAATR